MTEKLHINCVSCGNCQHPRDADNLSLFCMECPPNEAPCLKVCPKKAIEILGGAITLNKSKCDKCGESYGIDFPPKVEDVCDKCGGHLSVRTDDTKETLTKRINTYKENAKAILDFYREKGLLMTVDASHNPETVIDDAKM